MDDRKLLEMAARAAGVETFRTDAGNLVTDNNGKQWNPLTDDGDALRLAVNLKLEVCPEIYKQGFVEVYMKHENAIVEPIGSDIYAATRRAIVRAAAAIGERV